MRLGHVGEIAPERLEDVDGLPDTSFADAEHSVQQAYAGIVGLAQQQQRIERLPGLRIPLLGREGKCSLERLVAEHRTGREDRGQRPTREQHPLHASHVS